MKVVDHVSFFPQSFDLRILVGRLAHKDPFSLLSSIESFLHAVILTANQHAKFVITSLNLGCALAVLLRDILLLQLLFCHIMHR